jgi:uncharacterized protein (DUF697 family)
MPRATNRKSAASETPSQAESASAATASSDTPSPAETHRDEINRIIARATHTAAGIGLIPVFGVDILGISAVQVHMVYQLSRVYGVPFAPDRMRAVATALIGSVVPWAIAYGWPRMAIKNIPLVGPSLASVSMSVLSGASTWAIGRVYLKHLESGGNILNFDPEKMKDYFKAAFEEGKQVVQNMRNKPAAEPAH